MATAIDNKVLPRVLDLINRVGVTVTLKSETKTYNPATGKTTSSGVQNVAVKASPPAPVTTEMVLHEAVQMSDQVIYLAGKDATVTPVVGMEVTSKSKVYQIVSVKTYYSGDDIAAWECIIRR